jgi:hypothetical protein
MADAFSTFKPGLSSPAEHAAAITPSNDEDLANATRAIYVGGVGDIKLTTLGGSTVTLEAVPVGTVLNIRATKVFATGTTATKLMALW